ncbi:MAG: 2-C-methyl-D-erythritol 2,4-cyclodiphosphate synthase, partial [Solirubrobacterales bacterium]
MAGRPLVLGGVEVESDVGLEGHSDADVLTHAVIDAVLGAAGLDDIGAHFPDTDPKFRDADSLALLEEAAQLVAQAGFAVVNVDATLMLEAPKVGDYRARMRERLAGALGLEPSEVNVKATTGEGMDAVGPRGGAPAIAGATRRAAGP